MNPRDAMASAAATLRAGSPAPALTVDRALASDPPVFASLRSLLDTSAAVQPLIQIAHRVAYEARAVAICAPDKAGKSTFLATAVAHVTTGRSFLGAPTCRGAVLWAGLEEHLNDAVQRFAELGADPDLVDLVVEKPENLLTKITLQLAARTYVWTVLDSVSEYARLVTKGVPPSEGDTSGWSMVARPLVELCHRTGVALTALHHVRRDGEERGSTELFAAFDAVWVMRRGASSEDSTIRRFKGRGRRNIDVSDFAVRMEQRAYLMLGGATELSVDARVLLHVEQTPQMSTNKVRQTVGGRGADVDAALKELERRGAIRNVGSDTSSAWIATSSTVFGGAK